MSQLPTEPESTLTLGAHLTGEPETTDRNPTTPVLGDRYEILEPLGRGGVGEVYSARDRQLGRRVAVKVHRRDRLTPSPTRLVAEAQALARLTHPNVVTVHDVGVAADGRTFVAMEQVEGTTLAGWLEAETRSWREIARVMERAGRGVAAIHEAGLVHRDLKPSNLLVADDGRVLVSDLGLARRRLSMSETADGARGQASRPGDRERMLSPLGLLFGRDQGASGVWNDEIRAVRETMESRAATAATAATAASATAPGTVVGTPGYLAPEVLAGEPATPASDQYAFALTFWQALHGAKPGEKPRRGEPSRGATGPRWLRRLLERALDPRPERRFESMGHLLSALGRRLERRRSLFVAGLVLLGMVLALAPRGFGGPGGEALCTGAAERVATAWGPEARDRLERSFGAVGTPLSASSLERAVAGLDTWSIAWAVEHRQTCLATRQRGEQSEQLMDRRMACLDRALGEVGALVTLLGDAGPDDVVAAPEAVASLPSLDRCAATGALLTIAPRPDDPEARVRLDQVDALTARGEALFDLGRFDEAAEVARQALEVARTVEHPPTRARVALLVGQLDLERSDPGSAREHLDEAWWNAQAGADDLTLAHVAEEMVFLEAEAGRVDEARRWERFGHAALDRAGGDPWIEAELEGSGAIAEYRAERLPESLAKIDRALDLLAVVGVGEDTPVERRLGAAVVLGNRAAVLSDLGRNDEALADLRRSLDLRRGTLGDGHPDLLVAWANLGVVLVQAGRVDEAVEPLTEAVRIGRESLGRRHDLTATAEANLAMVSMKLGRLDEALALAEIALETRRLLFEVEAPFHPDLGTSHTNLGDIYAARGQVAAAERHFRRAIEIFQGPEGSDPHPRLIHPTRKLAELAEMGETGESRS